MTTDNWTKMIDTDFPPIGPVTEETRARTLREANRYRGSIRISTARFRTDQEHEERRQLELGKPLP